ncbi:hypothetical protein HKCCE3408_01780 [Rhodobacterales bacterium HKCCE3408]|nr:hypothetical protein [Rhodobacterales bacterium HKCCE3408]
MFDFAMTAEELTFADDRRGDLAASRNFRRARVAAIATGAGEIAGTILSRGTELARAVELRPDNIFA